MILHLITRIIIDYLTSLEQQSMGLRWCQGDETHVECVHKVCRTLPKTTVTIPNLLLVTALAPEFMSNNSVPSPQYIFLTGYTVPQYALV